MEIINLRERTEWTEAAAAWFHFKWEIAQEEYEKSIRESQQTQGAIPRWYLVTDNREIIAGVGVIENDFHKRKDLTPNLCALYVVGAEGLRESCCAMSAGRWRVWGQIPSIWLQTIPHFTSSTAGNFSVWLRKKTDALPECIFTNRKNKSNRPENVDVSDILSD